jgi:hypothetical protein
MNLYQFLIAPEVIRAVQPMVFAADQPADAVLL